MSDNTDPTPSPSPEEATDSGAVDAPTTAPTSTVAAAPPPKVRPMFVGVLLALAIAVAIAITVFSGVLNSSSSSETSSASNVTGQSSVSDDGMALPAGVPGENRGYIIGDPDTATVLVDVWADPQCPFCQKFHDAGDNIIDGGVASGYAAAEHFFVAFLGPESEQAANAIGCAADQGAYELFVDTMYLNQPQEGSESYTEDLLLRFGELSQIQDMETFTQCVQEGTYLEYVRALTEFMPQASVQGTPTVRLDGEDVNLSETTLDEFTAALNGITVAEVEEQRAANQANATTEPIPAEENN